MQHVLDQFRAPTARFIPATPEEYFALQLARKLEDLPRLREYLTIVSHHSQQVILQAFRRAVKKSPHHLGDQFRAELTRLTQQEDS